MYYTNTKDLPQTLQATLPLEAQILYLEVYNHIWEQYEAVWQDNPNQYTTAHQMAWEAVTNAFVQVRDAKGRKWYPKGQVPKPNGPAHQLRKQGIFQWFGFRKYS